MNQATNQEEKELPIALPEPTATDTSVEEKEPDHSEMWSEFSGEKESGDSDVEGDIEILEPSKEVASIVPPVAVPGEIPPVEIPTIVPPVETPPVPVVEPVPVPVSVPRPPVAPPEPFDIAKWEQEQLSGLEKLYAINEEDANRLQTEPEIMLPKLAANMHMTVTRSVMTAIQSMIPEILANQNTMRSADDEARAVFYGVNPDLNDPKYEPAVLQVAQMFRAANPSAPREVAVKTIGQMVRMSLGIAPPVAANPSAALLQPQAQARPFSPARGGGGGAPAKAPNIWDEFSNLDD